MHLKQLQKLGLTKQQAQIYLKLLELGPSSVGTLTKQLDIARISCYDTLNRLVSKGLVSFVKTRGTRHYQATDPQKLLLVAQEKEQQAQEQKQTIQDLLPQLNQLKAIGQSTDHDAQIYKTKEGMKSLFELMIKEKKQIHVISATGKALEHLKYYFPQWHKRREKLKIQVKNIFNEELKGKKVANMPYAKVKFLPKEYSSPSTTFVFGNYIATMLWGDVPFAFVIQSKEIAKSYRNYFKALWRVAK